MELVSSVFVDIDKTRSTVDIRYRMRMYYIILIFVYHLDIEVLRRYRCRY